MSNSVCYTNIGKLRCLLEKLGHSNQGDSYIEWIKGQIKEYISINMTLSYFKCSDGNALD